MEGARWQGRLGRARILAGAGTLAVALAATPAAATQRLHDLGLGPLDISGNLQTTELIRHPDRDTFSFVQQRNVFRTRVDWDWIRGSQLFDKYKIPGIRKSKLFFLYRFVYDSTYDTTPNFAPAYDFRGTALEEAFDAAISPVTGKGISHKQLTLDGLTQSERDAYKFENVLREAYADIKFTRIPLSLRVGRQQIIWGETDNFRMLDRVNSLDLSWHFQQEIPVPSFGWDDIRRPFWMLKALYEIGQIGPLSQVFTEVYWNPGDWHPVKHGFLPRPWGLQILDPLTNPLDGAFNFAPCNISEVATNPRQPGPANGRCTRLMRGTRLFEKGSYGDTFDVVDNSQVGARFHASTPQGLEFTLNYFWQRWSGDDGTNYAQLQAIRDFEPFGVGPDVERADALLRRGIFPAEFITPYIHTGGLSANYSDETYTQAVFRAETIVDFGIPFYDRRKRAAGVDKLLPGVSRKNMWKGMIAFDRPTWIKWLNKKSTVFITGQWFWHYLINNPRCHYSPNGDISEDPSSNPRVRSKQVADSCLTGGTDLPSFTRPASVSFKDNIRDWESIFTIAAFSFYKGGSVVPVVGYVLDPVNQWESEAFWTLDYFITPSVVVNLSQRYFINPTGAKQITETWGLTGLNRTRSETSFRLTYQF